MVDVKSSDLKNYVGKEVTITFPKAKDGGFQENNYNEIAAVWYGKTIDTKIVSVDAEIRLIKIFYDDKEIEVSFDFMGEVTYNN